MGLDMYLSAKKYLWKDEDEVVSKQVGKIIGVEGDRERRFNGSSLVVKEITLDAMYWRKANAIHGWFVDNAQNGDDDCKEYEVDREQLEKLRDSCSKILARHEAMKTMTDDQLEEMEDLDADEESLEPTEGFFFGSTDKDEWYYKDLQDTMDGLDRVLALPEDYYFTYRASW
jgi:chaperonin cofactor prefoldin